ncbi:MAG: DUF2203 domain-containing protein [Acidobacteria bacterium]|nr:MAG: DUF2203 domain-containing protein [Acidobacteriota bacterium]
MTTKEMKIFTIEEANSLLPSVRSILGKIQKANRSLRKYKGQAQKAAEAGEHGGGGVLNGTHYAQLVTVLTSEINQLEGLGVQLKDFERGLIDFPYLKDGRVVLLCWQLGEGDELEWWHDVDAGFAGRTPL